MSDNEQNLCCVQPPRISAKHWRISAALLGWPFDAEYGPRCNGLLLDDLILWIESVRCRHCGNVGASGEDHTCSCPLHDNDCKAHPSLSMAAQAAPADDQGGQMTKFKAPWSLEQTQHLNEFQHAGLYHPFTCRNRGDGEHEGEGLLRATTDGWVCPSCDYTQDWAHPFMAVPANAQQAQRP